MQSKHLETLVSVHQVQSFSKAAEIQNMTLSAVSMQMKALEEQLGADLFDRSFRPPKLTPLGRQVAALAGRVLAEQQAMIALCGSAGGLSGLFRLGFIQSASVRLLPGFLQAIGKTAPKAAFELASGLSEDLGDRVLLGQIDAAVVTRVARPPSGLHFRTIGMEEMAFAVPVALRDTPIDALPETLPFIHFRPTSGIGNLIAGSIRTRPKKTIVLDSLEASVECVKAGLGYTLLPLPDIERCASAQIHIHAGRADAMFRELAFVTRAEQAEADWFATLGDTLREVVASAA